MSFDDNFRLVEDDFGSEDSLALIKNFDPEVCFHLAAQSSVVVSVQDPVLDFEHNILQPIQLLHTLINSNCKKFVFTSSGGTIFGEPENIPTAENDYSSEPASPYGVAKKKFNEIIKTMTSNTTLVGKEGTSLRYRGFDATELTQNNTYEEVASLIITNSLDDKDYKKSFAKYYLEISKDKNLNNLLEEIKQKLHPMDVVRTIVSYKGELTTLRKQKLDQEDKTELSSR